MPIVASIIFMKPDFIWYFLSFKGRVTRQEFWLGLAGLIVITLLLRRPLQEMSLSYFRPRSGHWYSVELEVALQLPMLALNAALVWPSIAIEVKRLHDLNLSAWWLLVLPAIAGLAWAMNFTGLDIALWGNLAVLVVLGFVPGSHGGNRFGADPLLRTAS